MQENAFAPRSRLLSAFVVTACSLEVLRLADVPSDSAQLYIPVSWTTPWLCFLELLGLCLAVALVSAAVLVFNYTPLGSKYEWPALGVSAVLASGLGALVVLHNLDATRVMGDWEERPSVWYLMVITSVLAMGSLVLLIMSVFSQLSQEGGDTGRYPSCDGSGSSQSTLQQSGRSVYEGGDTMQMFSNPVAGGTGDHDTSKDESQSKVDPQSPKAVVADAVHLALSIPKAKTDPEATSCHTCSWLTAQFWETSEFKYATSMITSLLMCFTVLIYVFLLLLEESGTQAQLYVSRTEGLQQAGGYLAEYSAILEQQASVAALILEEQKRLQEAAIAAGQAPEPSLSQEAAVSLEATEAKIAELQSLISSVGADVQLNGLSSQSVAASLTFGLSAGLLITLLMLSQFIAKYKHFCISFIDLKRDGGPEWARFLLKHGGETMSEIFHSHNISQSTYLMVVLIASACGSLIVWAAVLSGCVVLYWQLPVLIALLRVINLLLRKFIGNKVLSDGQYIHYPRLWMFFFLVVSFTQVLEGLVVGALRIVSLVLLSCFAILRLDKAVLPAMKRTDVGYNSFMGNSLYELAVINYSGMQMGASIRQLFAAGMSSFRHDHLATAPRVASVTVPEIPSIRPDSDELHHSHTDIAEDLSSLKGTPFEAMAR